MGKLGLVGSLFCLILVFVPAFAKAANEFITVVNPVRIPYYLSDPVASLQSEYTVVNNYQIPATWLLTYDAINHKGVANLAKKFSPSQELGIFLEITPALATAAQVPYHQSGSWHFANSIFLSGYAQEERQKLIDTVFQSFKSTFGYYPVSVGAWWVDSFSLQYMHDKYQVIANLGCADQFATDNYQIWGQYWSTPFYPSKIHAAIPAATTDNKIGVVTIQWASREPRQGYYSSIYSTQDYPNTNEKYDTSYFAKLVQLYTTAGPNKFGQITVGLEGDLSPDSYQGEYSKQLAVVSNLAAQKVTMKDFAQWYQSTFTDLSPAHTISADGVTWYQSPSYRIGVDTINYKIIDLRVYPQNYPEPNYTWPNADQNLRIYIPSIIDSLQNKDEAWDYRQGEINFSPEYFDVPVSALPARIKNSPLLRYQTIGDVRRISPADIWPVDLGGLTFSDWSLETLHLFRSPKQWPRLLTSLRRDSYWVSQAETEGLYRLKLLPPGKVLVYDSECLQCSWYSKYRPAVYAASHHYISDLGGHPLVFNQQIFTLTDHGQARSMLDKSGARYVYLVKYGDYVQKLSFSPGDWGIKLIFENANVQIWQTDN